MKRLFKRGLSLLLAVLMVASLLPTSVWAVTFADGEDSGGREEIPVLDENDPSGPQGGSRGTGLTYSDLLGNVFEFLEEEEPEPVPTDDPGPEGEFSWANVTLDAVLVDETTGEVRITGTVPSSTNLPLGDSTIVLAPAWGSIPKLEDIETAGDINTGMSASTLTTDLPALLGVPSNLIYILDTSSGHSFKDGVWTHSAYLGGGQSYANYIKKANEAGASLTESGGIPMQVMLISSGSTPDICYADVTIQPKKAILTVDGAAPDVVEPGGDGKNTIYLDASATSFTFDVKHTDASSQTANITSIKWVGPAIGGTNDADLAAQAGQLSNPGSQTITVNLPYSNADTETGGDAAGDPKWIGQVEIIYNDDINTTPRYLYVNVVPKTEAEPIRITVVAGGPAVSGGPTAPTGGRFVFVSEDEAMCEDPYIIDMGGVADGSAAVTDSNSKDGIILGDGEAEDGVPGTMTAGYGVTSLMQVIQYEEYSYDWTRDDDGEVLLAEGFSWPSNPGNIIAARAGADVKPGEYSAGMIKVAYIDETIGMGYKEIPVIVTVKAADSFGAIFYSNGGKWIDTAATDTDPEVSHTTETRSTTDPTKKGAQITDVPDAPVWEGHSFIGWGSKSGATESEKLAPEAIKYSIAAGEQTPYYAIWKTDKITYTLKFDPNVGASGGTVDDMPSTATAEDEADFHNFTLDFTTLPKRKGYEFAGWANTGSGSVAYTDADGKREVRVNKDPSVNNSKTIYAVWTPLYTVTYKDATDADGHTYPKLDSTLPEDTKEYKSGASVTVDYSACAVSAEKSNGATTPLYYKFTGWTRSDTSTLFTGDTLLMPSKNLDLTATWEPVMLNVAYDLDGGTENKTTPTTDSSVPKTVQKGATYTIKAGDPTKTGYTFKGWSTGTTGGQTTAVTGLKTNGTVSAVTADLTLTAEWEQDTSTVTFNLDGGTLAGFTDGKLVRTGPVGTDMESKDFPSGTPTKSRHSFGGWKNGGTTYDKSNLPTYPATKDGNLDVTAVWIRDTSNIAFVFDGGQVGENKDGYSYQGNTGDELPGTNFPSTDPTKAGYTFSHWKGSDNKTYTSSSLPKFPDEDGKTLTITAQWKAVDNSVRFLHNYTPLPDGVSEPFTSQNVATGGHPTAPSPDPTRYGYNFVAWHTDKITSDDNKVTDFSTQTITAAKDYYASWAAKDVKVQYDAVHGDDPAEETAKFGATGHTLKGNTAITGGDWTTVDGNEILTITESGKKHVYRFDGWTRDGANTVTQIDIDDEGPIVVTAQWTELFTLTYNDNVADAAITVPDTVENVANGAATAVNTDALTRTGYTFQGWDTNANATTATYGVGETTTITLTGNTTLYAIWKINEYTVTYNNGSHGAAANAPEPSKGNYNTDVPLAAAMDSVVEDGIHWKSSGWSTTQDDATTKTSKIEKIAKDWEVFALWAKDKHSVGYSAGDASAQLVEGVHVTKQDECGFDYTIPNDEPTWDANHAFVNWKGSDGKTYAPGDKITKVTQDITLTAQWKAVVTVTWKTNGGTWTDAPKDQADRTQTGESTQELKRHPDPELDGYRFVGWKGVPNDPPADPEGGKATLPNTNSTYTAQWSKLYTVKFDVGKTGDDFTASHADNALDDQGGLIEGEETKQLPAVSDTQGNYVFKGWSLTSGQTSGSYAVNGKYGVKAADDTDSDAVITLYGAWVKKTTITFDLNGGQWTADADKTEAGDASTNITRKGEPGVDTITKPTDPKKEGYTFKAWAPAVDAKFPTTDTVYKAQWEQGKSKIEYNWNYTGQTSTVHEGLTGASDTAPAKTDATGIPTRVGYTWDGKWYAETGCTNEVDAFTFPTAIGSTPGKTYYANWIPNEHTVTYAPGAAGTNVGAYIDIDATQDGDQTAETFTYAATTLKAKSAADVVKWAKDGDDEGWTFTGWKSNETPAVTYAAGGELGTNAKDYDIILTAQWTVKVTFDPNTPADVGSDSFTVTLSPTELTPVAGGTIPEKDYPTPTIAPTKYTFDGWYDAPTGGNKVAATKTYDKPTTLYARWKEKEYTITFEDNSDDKNEPEAVTNVYGHKFILPAPVGDRTGYTFAGWFYEDEGGTTSTPAIVDAEKKFTIVEDDTLYGHWTPVTVKVIYQTATGTAPAEDSATYDGSYNVKDATHNTDGITGGDWSKSADGAWDIFTVTAEGATKGNRYRFNGWKVDGAGSAVGPTIDPVDTVHGVKAPSGDETSYTLTLVADWTPLYSVIYEPGDHGKKGTQPAGQQDQPAGDFLAAAPKDVIDKAAEGDSWDGTRYEPAADGRHWFFTGWKVGGTDTVISANTKVTTTNADVVLTAQWKEQYKVTLGKPEGKDLANTGDAAKDNFVTANLNGVKNSITAQNYTWVDVVADTSLGVTELTLGGPNKDNYLFEKWSVAPDGKGAFVADPAIKPADTLKLTGDVTITSHWLLKPVLVANDTDYHLNYKTGETIAAGDEWAGTKNELPKYTWTANDATIGTIVLTHPDGTTTTTLADGDQVDIDSTTTTGVSVITFKRTFLLGLAKGTYKLTVNATTGSTSTPTEANLLIEVTPRKLLQVDIGVKDATEADYEKVSTPSYPNHTPGSTTAKVDDADRGEVKYVDHRDTRITPSNLLTYEWYYGSTKPTQHTLADSAPALDRNDFTLPADAQKIKDNDITGVVAVDKADYKGKYIYAVAVATGTGTGAVITNSIPVDYDAVIKVQQDSTAIPTASKGQYSVYLVPRPSTGGNAPSYDGADKLPGGSVQAKAQASLTTAGLYQTDDSALQGGVTYDVYANKVEGDHTVYVKVPDLSVSTQINADATKLPTVSFYSVNAVGTAFDHAQDDNGDVPEDFTGENAAPTTKFTTAGAGSATIDVDSAKGVLSGTTVTAAAAKEWTQDYVWNWGEDHTSADEPPLTYDGTDKQTSGHATQNYTISAKSWIGGELEQKVYTIVGDIKGPGGKVAAATLTFKKDDTTTYTFTGTMNNGQPGDSVTFKVPKSNVTAGAITGNYILKATGATDPRTTVSGYCKPAGNTATDLTSIELDAVTENTDLTGGAKGDFTIFIDASTWQLKVTDDQTEDTMAGGAADPQSMWKKHDTAVTSADDVESGHADAAWTKMFANYGDLDKLTYNVTVSNPGNTNLTVSLAVKKTVSGTTTTIFDSSTALTGGKDANDVEFTGLDDSFDLAAKTSTTEDSKTFTITIPKDLDNNDDVTYSFQFTSVDKDDNTVLGPSLTYNLALTVDPIPVKSVAIKDNGDGTFSANDLDFTATNKPLDDTTGAPTLTTANDLTYQWYVGAKPTVADNGTVSGTAATGTGNGAATYTPATADGGKDLWLVVSGKNNASKHAIASVKAPYRAAVTILENTDETGDHGSYKVYLVPTGVDAPDFAADKLAGQGIVEANHHDDDDQGVFTTDGAKLVAGTTYNVWTNVVKGTTDAAYENSGALSTVTDGVATKEVVYHSVTVTDTTYDNKYAGLKGTDFFGTGTDGTTAANQTGTLSGTHATAAAGATTVASGGWVIKGTEVTFTHDAWTKDYALEWSNANKQGTDAAGGGSTAKATISANTTVDAKLTLNLYKVTGWAIGQGDLQYITMKLGDNTFTTKTDAPASGAIVAVTGGSQDKINANPAGKEVPFSVPKGDGYTVEAVVVDGTVRSGYHQTHADGTLVTTDTITKNIAGVDNFDVILTSNGRSLALKDNDSGADVTPHSASVMWEKGDPKTDKTKHTETLEYGYTSGKTITLTLTNESSEESAGVKQKVYNVVGKGGNAEGSPDSKVTWEASDEELKEDGTGTIAEMDGAAAPTVTLTIPTDLSAGTYTYDAVFTFAAAADGGVVGTLTYTLEIVVKPAEFATVTMKYDGADDAIDHTKILEAGKDLALHNATTTVNPVFDALTFTDDAKDYHYAWYASTDGTLNTTDDLAWTPADGSVDLAGATSLNVVDQPLGDATIAAHQSEYIYLVIYATKDNGKVIKAAVSDPVRAGYQGLVQIKEDNVLQETEPKTGEDPKYTVKIVKPDGSELPTVWSGTLKGYVACDGDGNEIYLDPTATYTVKTSAYAGDTTMTALTDATIKGDDLAGKSNIATAEYFTVTARATTAEHYVAAVADTTFDADNMPKAKLTIGAADVDGKTVLKGQNVAAKFPETATSSGVAWTQDYTLTWQDVQNNSADDTTALADVTGATGVTAADALTGRTWSSITAKTYIGGRLDQKTYTVTGEIVGTGSLASVVMTDGNGNANTTVADGTINEGDNEIANTNKNGTTGDQGDKITLKVVKGTYGLVANPATNTTVRGIKWASGAFEPGASVTGKAVPDGATFVVYLDAASKILRVQDTHTTPTAHKDDSNAAQPATNFKHADHTHEVYFSAMTADDTQTVELENQGNTDLTLDAPTLWKVNAGKALTDVKWSDWTNANPVTALEWTEGAYTLADVIEVKNLITDDNKTLTGAVDTDNDGTLDQFEKVTAATVQVSQNVDVADSGIYILRYTTGSTGPVVYYVLDLVVKPLPIVDVTATASTGTEAPGANDTVQLEGYTGGDDDTSFDHVWVNDDGDDATTAAAASAVTAPTLKDGADVVYQWVKTKTQMTAADVAGKLSVNATTGAITADTGVTLLNDNGAATKQYTIQSADLDSYLYLVAYAPSAGLNASELAVSDPIKTKETVKIQVTVNTIVQNLNDAEAPGYTIKLLPDGADAAEATSYITTTWNPNAAADKESTKFYTAAIDTTKKYKIYAETYKGSNSLVDTDLTLGKDAAKPTEATVPYFTVNYTENLSVENGTIDGFKSYLPGGTATETNAIQKALSVAVSDDKGTTTYSGDLPASGTPVLSGMNVKVTVDATKKNKNTTEGIVKSWKDAAKLHTMSTSGWSDTATSKTSGIEYADSIASADILVDGSKNFAASLSPVTFTVEFHVKDVTAPTKDTSTNITGATLSRDENKEPNATSFAPISAGTITGDGKDGSVVTFTKVPAGDLVIKAEPNAGTSTMVVGYTWNSVPDPVSTNGEIVEVASGDDADDINKHTGNVIQIQRATNLVQWMDNFNKTDASVLEDSFVNSQGFRRVDTVGAANDLSLPVGYDDTTHTLTYKARVKNVGTTDLEGFKITPNEVSGINLIFNLSEAKVYTKDGELKTDAGDVTSADGIRLDRQEYVEFPITIVQGKDAQKALYNTAKFTASCGGEGLPGTVDTYQPAYQVKGVIETTEGSAEMFYGDTNFDTASPAKVTQVGVSGGFTGQAFAYALLTESELTAYLNGAARGDNVYTTDGFEDNGVVGHVVPGWLKIDGTTGAITVDATHSKVGQSVHVQKTTDESGKLTDVTDELVVYVKITSTDDSRLKKIEPFTVNMKTSPLKVVTANTADAKQKTLDGTAYRDLYKGATNATPYPGQGEDIAHGAKVLLEYFNYTQVENGKNSADVLDNNGHTAYAAGANRWNSADGADNSNYGKVTKGHWGVKPAEFDGTGTTQYDPAGGATNSHDYTFTYYYDGTGLLDQYDYADATIDLEIPVLVPALSLKFADVVKNYDAVKSVLKADQAQYSAPGANADKSPLAALDYSIDAFRKDESITYLDEEPQYTVKLQQLGVIYGLTLTEKDKDGFEVVGGLPTELTFDENGVLSFEVKMTAKNSNNKLWAGLHTITIEASGYRTEDKSGDPVKATYVLNVNVDPKVIKEIDVTLDGPEDTTPDITGKTDDDKPVDDKTPDRHDNVPIKPGTVTLDKDHDEVTGRKITVEIDPNYIYTKNDPDTPDDEPEITDNTRVNGKDTTDPNVDVDRDDDKPDRIVHITQNIPVLMFDDVKLDNNGAPTSDKTGPKVDDTRGGITVVRGHRLGKYEIYLGAYGGSVYDVKPNCVYGVLDDATLTEVLPSKLDQLDDVGATPAGAKNKWVLDLGAVDTAGLALGAHTLKLTAAGDAYDGGTSDPIQATYTLTITVVKAPTPVLKFHDTPLTGNSTDDTVWPNANGDAAKDYVRTIYVQRGKTLGQYFIDLAAETNTALDVKVTKPTDALPEGAVWTDREVFAPQPLGNMAPGEDGKHTYAVLDLRNVDTTKLMQEEYTLLVLNAEGTSPNAEDAKVEASYTLELVVTPADPSVLMFKDLRKDGTGAGTTNFLNPAEDRYGVTYTREITVPWDKASNWWYPLGTYDITLGAFDNLVKDVQLNSSGTVPSSGVLALGDEVRKFNDAASRDMDVGGTWTYALDLSDVDYRTMIHDKNTQEWNVVLTAKGTDLNGANVTATYKLTVTLEKPPVPVLKFDDEKQGGASTDPATTGPEVNDERVIKIKEGTQLGKYTIYLGAYDAGVKVTKITSDRENLVYNVTPDCTTITPVELKERKTKGDAQAFILDLTGMDTSTVGTYKLTLEAVGEDMTGLYTGIKATYELTITITKKPQPGGGGGGGGTPACPSQVSYLLGLYGTTKDPVMEMVTGKNVKTVPTVSAIAGYKFLGWSLAGPIGDADKDAARTLVDPKEVPIEGDTTFYAVYQPLYDHGRPFHKHYVIGYPNGNFGPSDNINRASVATIIARAVLPNFVEGADYGNPGNYSDVNGHWAASAIAYCTRYGVFKGYEDGTFRPDQPISRQELVLTLARLSGEQKGSAPFSDIGEAGDWAKGGIYTAYVKGWVNGYTDGTFRPTNPIARDETVKIFNAYLYRGVNAEGLASLTEYVHSGVASNNTENGTNEYMTWPDVPKDQWAYYEIIEAANDHEYKPDATKKAGYTVPEVWTKCWIDERWRYNDDANDGGPAAVTLALLRKYGVIA